MQISSSSEKTVTGRKAKKLVELVKEGKAIKKAEKEAGITIREISTIPGLSKTVQNLLQEWNLSEVVGEHVVKSRLYQLLIGAEDEKTSVAAAGQLSKILGTEKQREGGSGPMIQINIGKEEAEFLDRTKTYVDVKGEVINES